MLTLKFDNRFVEKIKNGIKKTTIRKDRKNKITSKESYIRLVDSQSNKILKTRIKKISKIKILIIRESIEVLSLDDEALTSAEVSKFIATEGFENRKDFIDFLKDYYKDEVMIGKVIEWD